MQNEIRRLDLTILPGLLLGLFFLSAWLIPLCGDEAYYWLWSIRPEWGYCDHPPAVAWLGHLLQWGEGVNAAFFRIPGLLAYVGAVLVMARLASDSLCTFSSEGADGAFRWTIVIAAVSPLLAHYATEMGPDSPLILAWSLGCWATYRALYRPHSKYGSAPFWLLFGAASALAIYSKLTGWLLPLCLLGFLVTSKQRRPYLGSLGLWQGVLAGLVLLLPHLIWNYLHDGQNYFFQWHLRRQHMAWQAGHLLKPLELFADQGLLSLYTLAALVFYLRRDQAVSAVRAQPVITLLMWFSLPLQGFFFVFRLLGVGRWNWPLPSYLPLSALLALWLVETGRDRRWDFRLALWATAVWTVGSLALRAFPQFQIATANYLPPALVTVRTNDLALAYPEVGARMHAAAAEGLFLLNDDYTEAAALSYYSGSFVRVVAPFREGSQFLVWNRYDELLGRDALLVCHRPLEDMGHVLHALQSSFQSYKRLPAWQISTPSPLTFYPVRCNCLIRPLLQNPHPEPLDRSKTD